MTSLRCHHCGATFAAKKPSEEPYDLNPGPGTRHHALLNSNEEPLDSDVVFVKLAISKADARLEDLDGEIARLREQLKQLEEEHVSLSTYRARNQAILSPLRRMPPEVLGEIFSWTLPSLRVARTEGIQITHSPWVLTHVIRRWRAIAVSSPSLWSLVAISYQPHKNPSSAYPLSMIETQIVRAQAQALKIHFYGCALSNPRPQIELFECLAKHATRWEELSIELTLALFPSLANLRGRVPSLRRLWIQWDKVESQSTLESESIDCFEMAPSLVDVTVCSVDRFIPIRLPMEQLTRWSIDAPWETQQAILKLGPNVVEARIWIAFDDEPWPDHGAKIQLSCLRRLFVSHSEILAYLTFPVLEELAIQTDEQDGSDALERLEASLVRSSCPLRRLCFSDWCPRTAETLEVLRKFPLIIELGIIIKDDESEEVNTLVTNLVVSDESRVISPQLSCLSFGRIGDHSYLDCELYLRMVESRWNSACCALTSAALLSDSDHGPEGAVLHRLNALRERGLDLVLLNGPDAKEVVEEWLFCSQWN